MYEDREIIELDEMGTTPFYLHLTASTWRAFIKYRHNKCDLESEARLIKAAETLYCDLEKSDKELLQFYGKGHGIPNDALAGYSYETHISRSEVQTRFNWLCYRLALQAGLINKYAWLEPPEHHEKERNVYK